MQIAAAIMAVMVMIIGIAGSILPFLPGIPLVFLAVIGYGWYEGFKEITVHYVAMVGALTILSLVVDYLSGVWGAKKVGSSKAGIIGAFLGVVIGVFFGPLGILLGPLAGAFAGEYLMLRDFNQAAKVAIGTMVGVITGVGFKMLVGIGVLISFLVMIV